MSKITTLPTEGSRFAIIVALLLTAFYFPVNNWSTIQGTEVGGLAFILTISTYLVIRAFQGHLSMLLFVVLGVGVLGRLDFAIPAMAHILMLLIFDPKERIKIITRGIPLFLLVVLPPTFVRWLYYGDFLPNTYYLKMTGVPVLPRIIRGIYVTLKEITPII